MIVLTKFYTIRKTIRLEKKLHIMVKLDHTMGQILQHPLEHQLDQLQQEGLPSRGIQEGMVIM